MVKKKCLALIMTCALLGTSTVLPINVSAATIQGSTGNTTVENIGVKRTAGIVTVTCSSGANVRSGPGTNYSKIGTANWGAELEYAGVTRYDSHGVAWYQVAYRSGYAWISSQVGHLG